MHADPALSEPYVPPGLLFKSCLVLALATGGALIVPVHYLTPRKVDGNEKNVDLSDVVHFVPVKTSRSAASIQLASASQPFKPTPLEPMPFAAMPAEPMPAEPMPIEPMPLEPMPVEAMPEPTPGQSLVSVEETPWYLEQPPAIEAAPTPIEQTPTADETYVFQEQSPAAPTPVEQFAPVDDSEQFAIADDSEQFAAVDDSYDYPNQPPATPIESAFSLPPSPASDAPPEAPLFAVAAQPTESPSDAPPMPAIDIDAMPMPAPEATAMQEPAPVVDAAPIEVAPIDPGRGITCTSPVPEPFVASPLKPTMPQGVQPPPRQVSQPYRAYSQPARPAAQQTRQSFNHPGYGSYTR